MPGFDRTGPLGQGSMTGRGMGSCGESSRGTGRGFIRGAGRGFGRGMGFRRGFIPAGSYGSAYAYEPTKEQETADLKAEKEAIMQEIRQIDQRLKELESKK